jgi:hypothetical protein
MVISVAPSTRREDWAETLPILVADRRRRPIGHQRGVERRLALASVARGQGLLRASGSTPWLVATFFSERLEDHAGIDRIR